MQNSHNGGASGGAPAAAEGKDAVGGDGSVTAEQQAVEKTAGQVKDLNEPRVAEPPLSGNIHGGHRQSRLHEQWGAVFKTPDSHFATLDTDSIGYMLDFFHHVDLCALSNVEPLLVLPVRKEQSRRDKVITSSDAEQLQVWCELLKLPCKEVEELGEYTDPRERDFAWDTAPLHARFSMMDSFVERVMKKITLELHVGDRLQNLAEAYEGMLLANGYTDHLELDPVSADTMGRVMGCFYKGCFEQSGTRDCDLASLLAGDGTGSTGDTAPRDTIFEILIDAIGYDHDPRSANYSSVYIGEAGSLGRYAFTLKTNPDFVLAAFSDRPLLSDAEHVERRSANAAFVGDLFEWKW